MRKCLLSLCALLLSATAIQAQTNIIKGEATLTPKVAGLGSSSVKKSAATPKRITLEEGEKIMGFYTGDDMGSSRYALGFGTSGTYLAGCEFTPDVTSNFVGGQITKVRFGLWKSVGASSVTIYTVPTGTSTATEVSKTTVPSTAAGWNDVTLSSPVTIEDGYDYLIAYEWKQVYGEYPLACDYAVNPNGYKEGGMLVYGTFSDGTGWHDGGPDCGNFLIQAIVKGGQFADYDISLASLTTAEYNKKNATMDFSFIMSNSGNKSIDSYTLKAAIDGQDIDATFNAPTPLSGSNINVTGSLVLPETLASGNHTLKVYVADINGAAPTTESTSHEVTADFTALANFYPHQKQLIEHYTSQYCTYCPYGYDILNALTTMRDDIAWVSIHNDMSGNSDKYTIDDAAYISAFSCGGFPAAAFNRYYIDESFNSKKLIALSIGYQQTTAVAGEFSEIIDQTASLPAFATVNISSTYDPATSKCDITVSGEKSDDFSSYVGDDAVLTVYLTEDSLVSGQLNQGTWVENYPHNNVLRKIVTAPLGDAINWSGNTYENTYSVTFTEGWWTGNMNIIAFISRPIKLNSAGTSFTTKQTDAWVNNAEKVHLGNSSGIIGVVNDAKDAKVVARYTIDGRKIDAPVKGVNIVKLANGKAMKVIVK